MISVTVKYGYMAKKNLFLNIRSILAKNWFLLLTIAVGIFLRFFRLEAFTTFLGDQGRDAIIIKRIVTFEHFPAIGAPTSVGQVYLGPFYYYFIAPWLFLFGFEPVGLAFGVAFFSSVYLLVNHLVVGEIIDKKTALISTFLLALSAVMVEFSRFSWNPNLLPFFSLLTAYFFVKALQKRKILYFILSGACLSFSVQLHYLAFFLAPPLGLYYLYHLIKERKKILSLIAKGVVFVLSFFVCSSPLLIFDLRHNFLNTNNFLNMFKQASPVTSNKLEGFYQSFVQFNKYIFNLNLAPWSSVVLLFLILVSCIFLWRKKNPAGVFFLFFLMTLAGVSFYGGPKYEHYFGIVYPFYFVVVAYVLSFLTNQPILKTVLVFFLLIYAYLNIKTCHFFYNRPSRQILHAKTVAAFLDRKIDNNKFNFAVWPDDWQEDTYLYFLELRGKRPVDRKKVEISNQMYVVCGKPCDLKRVSSWNIRMFGQFRIADSWRVDNVTIYKLIR